MVHTVPNRHTRSTLAALLTHRSADIFQNLTVVAVSSTFHGVDKPPIQGLTTSSGIDFEDTVHWCRPVLFTPFLHIGKPLIDNKR